MDRTTWRVSAPDHRRHDMARHRRERSEEEAAIHDGGRGCRLPWWMVDPESIRAEQVRQEAERRELTRQLDELEAGL